jgi:hypothetical protein
MNAKNWRACIKDGVTKSKPVYAAQIALYQAYMEGTVSGDAGAYVHWDPPDRERPHRAGLRVSGSGRSHCATGLAHRRPPACGPGHRDPVGVQNRTRHPQATAQLTKS